MADCNYGKFQDDFVLQPSEEKTEADNVSSLELQRNCRILYFSDGTVEEGSDSEMELDLPDKNLETCIFESEMSLGPLLKYKAHKIGANILSGIDYFGNGLANFLGITTLNYGSEMEYYLGQQNKDIQLENETWRPKKVYNLVDVITTGPLRMDHSVNTVGSTFQN